MLVDRFLREARKRGVKISRRTLQFYSSPSLRLIPTPTHVGGHRAHLPTSLLDRLELIWILSRRYRLTLRQVRAVLPRVEAGGYAWAAKHRFLTRDDLLALLRSDVRSVTIVRLMLMRALGAELGTRSTAEVLRTRDIGRMRSAVTEARERLKRQLDGFAVDQMVLLLGGAHPVNPRSSG